MTIRWRSYPAANSYDELVRPGGQMRPAARMLGQRLVKLTDDEVGQRRAAAELAIQTMGITFTVYSQKAGGSIDRAWPFDIVPRIIPKSEWDRVEEGLKQRVQALNLFIDDIYHQQKIVKDGVFPKEVLAKSRNFRPQCVGINPPFGTWMKWPETATVGMDAG